MTEEGGSTVISACSLALRLEGRPRPGRAAGVAASSWASAAGTSVIVSSAVPLDTLRERRADRGGFAASLVLDGEWCLVRVDTPVSVSSSADPSSASAMVSKPALLAAAVDFRRVPVDFMGVVTRFLGVALVPRRAGVAGGSCLTSEEGTALLAVLVGLGVFLTTFLGGLLTALGTGVRFPGVFAVFVGGLRTADIFRPVPFAAERILVLRVCSSSLGLGLAVFAFD